MSEHRPVWKESERSWDVSVCPVHGPHGKSFCPHSICKANALTVRVIPAAVTDEMVERGARALCGIPDDIPLQPTDYGCRMAARVLRAALEATDDQ